MKRIYSVCLIIGMMILLTGCGGIGEKAASMSIVYGCAAVLSFLLLILFRVTNIRCAGWLPYLLFTAGVFVFLVAASPGYLDIYYREVSFSVVGGVSMLHKVYGPWHVLYLIYLLTYFGAMIALVLHAMANKKMTSLAQAVFLAAAVFVNLGVWLIEQLVKIDFEILSLSYIICELFLLGLHLLMQENARMQEQVCVQPAVAESVPSQKEPGIPETICEQFLTGTQTLTKTERAVYECYLEGKSTKEVLAELNIKENTLKFHNKNLYGKLGVSSRKQLLEVYRYLHKE